MTATAADIPAGPSSSGARGIKRGAITGLVIASALWGTAVTGTKYCLRSFDPLDLIAVQLLAATAVLWLVLLRRGRCRPPSLRLAVVLGCLEPGAAYLLQAYGLARTGASCGALVCGLESAFVVVLAAVFLQERISRTAAIAIALALGGLVVLAGGNPFHGSGSGDAFVALGVLCASGYTIVVKRYPTEPDPLALTVYQFTAATALAVTVFLVRAGSTDHHVPVQAPASAWLSAAAIGIFGLAVSFLLFNRLISDVPAGGASIVLNLIPAFGVVTAVILLGEELSARTIAGAALIAASVAAFVWYDSSPSTEAQEERGGASVPQPRAEVRPALVSTNANP